MMMQLATYQKDWSCVKPMKDKGNDSILHIILM
jgi:hypothetical protein